MAVKGALKLFVFLNSSKDLIMCSTEQRNIQYLFFNFSMVVVDVPELKHLSLCTKKCRQVSKICGWVNNNRISIYGCTIPLRYLKECWLQKTIWTHWISLYGQKKNTDTFLKISSKRKEWGTCLRVKGVKNMRVKKW